MRVLLLFCLLFTFGSKAIAAPIDTKKSPMPTQASQLQEYITYFHQVFDQLKEHYFVEPKAQDLEKFIEKFKTNIYPQLAAEGKSTDYVRWRASWFLINQLKHSEDHFTQFYPPKPAQEFQKDALGQRVDLGIEGEKTAEGFLVKRVEPHSDAYFKGLRDGDIIFRLKGQMVVKLDQKAIDALLNPIVDTIIAIDYKAKADRINRTIKVKSQEYFKQTVFLYPVAVPGIFCLEIPKFNRLTGDELFKFLELIKQQNPQGLIIDLRGNPGGPPLAAREMAGYFLKGGDMFTYFQRRDFATRSELDVPMVDAQYKYDGPIVILVNKESGSAAELFTGIMQFRRRALVLGENTAGQILLKSMFELKDGAMIAMVTGLGYYPDEKSFGFKGITPDRIITEAPKDGLINFAATMIVSSAQLSGSK